MLIPYKLDGTLLKLHPCLRPGRRSRLCLAEEVAEDGLQDVPVPCEGLGPLGRLGLPRFGLLVVFPVLFGPLYTEGPQQKQTRGGAKAESTLAVCKP